MEQQAEKRLLACGLMLAAWLWVLPAAADELDAEEDALVSLGALSASGAWAGSLDVEVGSDASILLPGAAVSGDVRIDNQLNSGVGDSVLNSNVSGHDNNIGNAVAGQWYGAIVHNEFQNM